jgi:hypothetical protein
VCLTSTAAYEACKVCLFRLKVCIFSEHYSLIMFVTDVSSLRQLPTGSILVQVPKGMKPGEAFVLDVKKGKVHDTLGARQQALVQQLPKSRKVSHIVAHKHKVYLLFFFCPKSDSSHAIQALQQSFKGDLTSLDGMLKYERSLRSAMGKLKNRWPAGLKVPKADGQVERGRERERKEERA